MASPSRKIRNKKRLVLELSTALYDQVEPFLHLKELDAVEKKGKWTIAASTGATLFVENFATLAQAAPPLNQTRPGAAGVHFIVYPEFRLLAFLLPSLSKSVQEHLLAHHIWSYHAPTIEMAQTDEFRDLVQRYLQACVKVKRRPPLIVGDMLEFNFALYNITTTIYDGNKFVELMWDRQAASRIIPRCFASPAPFPIKYWSVTPHARYRSKVVWPNFDKFMDTMEFDASPPPLPYQTSAKAVALRFAHERQVYYIYFVGAQALTYDEVLTVIKDSSTRYEAFCDTIMLCHPALANRFDGLPVGRNRNAPRSPIRIAFPRLPQPIEGLPLPVE